MFFDTLFTAMDVYTDKDQIMTLDKPVTVAVMLTYLPSCDYKTVQEYAKYTQQFTKITRWVMLPLCNQVHWSLLVCVEGFGLYHLDSGAGKLYARAPVIFLEVKIANSRQDSQELAWRLVPAGGCGSTAT